MRNSCIPPLSLKPFCARIMDDLLVAHHILERAIDPFSVERVLLGSQVFPSQKKNDNQNRATGKYLHLYIIFHTIQTSTDAIDRNTTSSPILLAIQENKTLPEN